MKFVDTNIFLRYLVKPLTAVDQRKHAACAHLFRRLQVGDEQARTCEAVVAEVLYVLCSPRQYSLSPADAAARLRPLLALRGLRLPNKRVYVRALDLFTTYPFLDVEDAFQVAHMEREGIEELYSYDTDFDRLPTIARQEP